MNFLIQETIPQHLNKMGTYYIQDIQAGFRRLNPVNLLHITENHLIITSFFHDELRKVFEIKKFFMVFIYKYINVVKNPSPHHANHPFPVYWLLLYF